MRSFEYNKPMFSDKKYFDPLYDHQIFRPPTRGGKMTKIWQKHPIGLLVMQSHIDLSKKIFNVSTFSCLVYPLSACMHDQKCYAIWYAYIKASVYTE